MNRHQVLTGASNHGDQCYAIGSVEGIHFTAYAAGSKIVILASDFQRVQIIPLVVYGGTGIQVSCIDCSPDGGKIAASYGKQVYIFEPTPLLNQESSHKLDYQWYRTGTIETEYEIYAISWNHDGSRLLTGGNVIQMWELQDEQPAQKDPVEFFIEGISEQEEHEDQDSSDNVEEDEDVHKWSCIWYCSPANTVYHIKFSSDGLLFASAGKSERLVKVWYENKKIETPMDRNDSVSPRKEEICYLFVYLAHPLAVTGFSWRKTSKYMSRASVANMLITSCKDNICRIWCETILPEDGLVDLNQLEPHGGPNNPGFHTQRHKKRFMQRLHHIRQVMHKRKKSSVGGGIAVNQPAQMNFPSSMTVHDFHKFGVHPNSVAPGFHFHLAASINPETDIPLIPSMGTENNQLSFVVHWLNNKELHFTLESEKLLEKLSSNNSELYEEESNGDLQDEEEGSHHDGTKEPPEMHIYGRTPPQHPPTLPLKPLPARDLKTMKGRHGSLQALSMAKGAQSSVDSDFSVASTPTSARGLPLTQQDTKDPLDSMIEHLLRDWHHSPDMLFSIHPQDGSYLVWSVDWLDEYNPGSFRQAQISFSSRIPAALPVGDAMTMAPNVMLYCNYRRLDLKSALNETEHKKTETCDKSGSKYTADAMGKNSPGQSDNTSVPNVLLLSKHDNGSLNLWQISFGESSKFSTILSIAHASRVSGHRFHTNYAACHPVLPLLLTTSHHNLPPGKHRNQQSPSKRYEAYDHEPGTNGYCSELILWQVSPVGPLSKSGGVSELARVNSPEISAFTNVAWLPTLLPSSSLGSYSNSPSALFIACDGKYLRMYQSVIDARTLLQDFHRNKRPAISVSQRSSNSSEGGYKEQTVTPPTPPREAFNIVSQQSTARPGCIIEREVIKDCQTSWGHIELMHIFQEQMITGERTGRESGATTTMKSHASLDAIIDLQHVVSFEENFFLVMIEKVQEGHCVLHMWKIVISSQMSGEDQGPVKFSPDVEYTQDDDEAHSFTHRKARPSSQQQTTTDTSNLLRLETVKVCTQTLELPSGVAVLTATVAAGHLSSSSIYPACFAPYLISTGCSDGRVRFWRCNTTATGGSASSQVLRYEWQQWEMMMKNEEELSDIRVAGKPIAVSCAYSGRVAVAYKLGGVKYKHGSHDKNKYVNFCVSIYECESTGGSEWTLEDTIELKNISLPDPKVNIDMRYIQDDYNSGLGKNETLVSPSTGAPSIIRTTAPVPSHNTITSVKKSLSEKKKVTEDYNIKRRHLVQLDWNSMEDGTHILTVGIGPEIILYTAVSGEIASASKNSKGNKNVAARPTRGILQKSKSMTVQNVAEEIRWMKIRSVDLTTEDGLPPVPMHISWVRDGILIVGMDNEMHVYSQWRGGGAAVDMTGHDETDDGRAFSEQSLKNVLSSSNLQMGMGFKVSPSVSNMKLPQSMSSASISMLIEQSKKKDASAAKGGLSSSESTNSLQYIPDCGLFEAARLVNPVLPQYHPKQLLELLSFGKIRRVKAILAHLVRCISGRDNMNIMYSEDSPQLRHRSMSVGRPMTSSTHVQTGDGSTLPEDINLDYIEISSIPPLPLYALLAADALDTTFTGTSTKEGLKSPTMKPPGGGQTQNNQDYSTLFNPDNLDESLDDEDPFDENEELSPDSKHHPHERRRKMGGFAMNANYFGPSTASLLSKHLTHTHLPGLSSLDQMYLMALADTVANTKLDFTDESAADVAVKKVLARENNERDETSTENVDDCGLRYHLAARHHVYLMNTLPIHQRRELQRIGLSPAYFVWAFHSEAEEELFNVIPGVKKGEPVWAELRQFGVGWWLTNINSLRRCIEKVAKHAFQVKKDPLDAAIFYLAMKKKAVLWGLFRSVSDSRMEKFFKNNFKEERWRKAALKNAFSLLGKQRFHHAAAFFLLAGAVRDAIEVCMNKLDDLQLGMVIARLYECELDSLMPQNLKRIIYEECLGYDQHGQSYDQDNAHLDPFIRSMAYWMLKDYSAALGTLLDVNTNLGPEDKKGSSDISSSCQSVFNFYNYLRTHPLLVRQQLAVTAANTNHKVFLSGFVHGNQKSSEKNVTFVDKITPIERRLYFTTAHTHFKSGCPMLALEVLSKLPEVMDLESDITKSHSADSMQKSPNKLVESCSPSPNKPITDNVSAFSWDQPVQKKEDGLELDWSDDNNEDDSENESDKNETETNKNEGETNKDETNQPNGLTVDGGDQPEQINTVGDIMAQQLKFIACMKILMEELSTLATGFEVDGGQLRFQLYIWLEKEVEVLKRLCNYGPELDEYVPEPAETGEEMGGTPQCRKSSLSHKPTLHEIILSENMDFENKQIRTKRRKQWLKSNQQLLRTLLSYSVVHGSGGGGLASVRMELILLLQELQQEKIQKQLLSPLPFPTTLPLLSASVASAKTVIADPIRYLQSVIHDILHTVIEFRTPPSMVSPINKAFTLRNISAALSACIYQALCDSDNFVVAISDHVDVGMEGFTSTNVVYKDSYLMAGAQRKRKSSSGNDDIPNSVPAKWPGVSSLRTLLAKECDEDCPKITILLCESLISVYMSLFIHALAVYDCNILYRLVAHTFTESMWATLFGGGMRKLMRMPPSADHYNVPQAKDELSKQRMKLHMKVLQATGTSTKLKEDKPTYKEKFIPPEVSMISYLMAKPYENPNDTGIDYDSTESLSDSEEEEDDEFSVSGKTDVAMNEHLNAHSYSWCLMRYACVKYITHTLEQFLPQVGIELPELPVCSPLVQSVLKTLKTWEEVLKGKLDLFSGPPMGYIPGCYVDVNVEGPTILKYKSILDPRNTPFLSSHPSALPAKRLWHYLVRKEYITEVFIRYIFKKKKVQTDDDPQQAMKSHLRDMLQDHPPVREPMKIIHKEQESITAFCINQANLHCLSVATQKEVVEMDITNMLNPPVWLEDETEYDIQNIKRPNVSADSDDFLLVHASQDRSGKMSGNVGGMPPTALGALPAPSWGQFAGHTGMGAGVLGKRKIGDIRRMGTHPHLPYYLTGAQDGSVLLWEWGHHQSISVARQPGSFPKATKVLFNAQGNKFGVSDGEGGLCLWQVDLGVNMNKPYLNWKCHTKTASDFVFVGSSSLLATAGHSSESRNVCLWDTLLPQRNSLVQAFHCHNDGSPAIVFAPQHQILISGGKKGEVCIFDVRQRQIRHTFQAHDSAVKSMALDPLEEYFVTGSADGDVKIWGLTVHNLIHAFTGEHAKGSLFSNVEVGVTQLYLSTQGHMFSCGGDGSLKVRNLPSHDEMQNTESPTSPHGMKRRMTVGSLTGMSDVSSSSFR